MKRTTPSAILLLTILFALTTRVSVAVAEDGEYFGVFSGEPSLKVQS